jgi:hypothetical protein
MSAKLHLSVLLAIVALGLLCVSTASALLSGDAVPGGAFTSSGGLTDAGWAEIDGDYGTGGTPYPDVPYPEPRPVDGVNHADIDPVINEARVDSHVFPDTSVLVQTGTASSGAGLGSSANAGLQLKSSPWQVSLGLGLGTADVYVQAKGDIGTTVGQSVNSGGIISTVSGVRWYWAVAGTTHTQANSATFVVPLTGWYVISNECQTTTTCTPGPWGDIENHTATPPVPPDSLSSAERLAFGAAGAHASYVNPVSCTGCTGVAANNWVLYMNASDMAHYGIRLQRSSPTQFANSTDKLYYYYGSPSAATLDRVAAAAAYDVLNGSRTDPQKGAQNALNTAVANPNPTNTAPAPTGGGSSFSSFVLPQPDPNQTYQQYLEELRSRGYVGTVTIVDDSSVAGTPWPGGAVGLTAVTGAITSLQLNGTTVGVFDTSGAPVAWPVAPPILADPAAPLQIEKIPNGYAAPPGTATVGIDLTPLTSLSPGCHFPYGFICYAQSLNSDFNVSAVAPDFNFALPSQTLGGHTYSIGTHYNVNLNVMDSYMSTIRTLLSVVIWVGAVYLVAVKLLGFGAGGDPGAAVDEGLPL